jgi:DGQHR domain-containing protein
MPIEIKNVLRVEDSTGPTVYLGSIYPSQIKELTFVPVVVKSQNCDAPEALNEFDEEGYQRAGEPARMKKIKEFYSDRKGALIPPVLLSSRGKWKFKAGSASKNIGTIHAEALAAVIDGQHRLGGLWRLANDAEADPRLAERAIPFMLVNDLDVHEERRNFVDINDNQKGVKKSLTKYLDKDKTFTGQAALALMEDDASVFKGRIAIQKNDDSTLVLFGAIEECVALMFSRAFVNTMEVYPEHDDETRAKCIEVILEYWDNVSKAWPEFWGDIEKMPPVGQAKSKEHPGRSKFDWRLLEETGLRAVSRLGSDLLMRHWLKDQASPSMQRIYEDLTKLAKSEKVRIAMTKPSRDSSIAEKYPDLKSTGKAGVAAIYDLLYSELLRQRD